MQRLQIGIDGHNLAMPHGTGVSTYGYVLADAIKGLGYDVTGVFGLDVGTRQETREILFFDRFQRAAKPQKRKSMAAQGVSLTKSLLGVNMKEVLTTDLVEKSSFRNRMPGFNRLLSYAHLYEISHDYFRITGRFLKVKIKSPPAIMHWTYPLPVKVIGSKNIYTLHDLVPLKLPYTTLDVKRIYYKLIKRCLIEADLICTVSEASKSDILKMFQVEPEKIYVTYQASPIASSILETPYSTDSEMVEGIFGLKSKEYFLFFGAIEPKKNIGRLIEAYLTTQSNTPLVIVGSRAWESEKELQLLSKGDGIDSQYGQRISSRVIRLEYLPRRLLLRLIRCAKAVLFPSLYEGFGLPVHESMLLGTPVLTGNTSSLPEVAGNAAVMVNPYETEQIAQAIVDLDGDAQMRLKLSQAGLIHSARFSLENYQTALSSMYEFVLNDR